MDLLGGYGSDDASSGNDFSVANHEESPQKKSSNIKSVTGPSPHHVANKKAFAVPTKTRRRLGKRIVSLHAVLPPEIRDGLTKNNSNYLSDDSSDQDETPSSIAKTGAATKNKPSASLRSNDAGLNSFLSELLSAAPSSSSSAGVRLASTATTEAAESLPIKKSEPMGLSLMSTTTTTTTRSAKDKVDIVDIHQVSSSMASTELKQTETPIVASATLPAIRTRMPAAPPLHSRPTLHTVTPSMQAQSLQTAQQSQPQEWQQTPNTMTQPQGGPKSRKKTKQQLEAALRSGQFDTIQSDQVVTAEAPQQQDATYLQSQQLPSQYGLKKSAVKLYNPSMGTDTLQPQVTSKHRSKHQINQLMAAAVNLENQRNQRAGMPQNVNSSKHRINAKRKYGW